MKWLKVKSINGYSLYIGLLCLFLLVQIVSFICSYILQTQYLIQANYESVVDLSCMSYARHIIDHNNRIRICNLDTNGLIKNENIVIDGIQTTFYDRGTYIECFYKDRVYRIYYDDKNISGFDVLKKVD